MPRQPGKRSPASGGRCRVAILRSAPRLMGPRWPVMAWPFRWKPCQAGLPATTLLVALDAGLRCQSGRAHPPATTLSWRTIQPDSWIWICARKPRSGTWASGQRRCLWAASGSLTLDRHGLAKMAPALSCGRSEGARVAQPLRRQQGKQHPDQRSRRCPRCAGPGRLRRCAVEQAVAAGRRRGPGPNRHLVRVQGQGSLCLSGSSASLPLIRGASPPAFLLVHGGQTHVKTIRAFPLPP